MEAVMKKFELWSLRLSKKNYYSFPNHNNFLKLTEEELSDEDSKYLKKIYGKYATQLP